MSIINQSSNKTCVPLSRKRKLSDTDIDSSSAIIIKRDGRNESIQNFHISSCIHRSQLPLTFLDYSNSPGQHFTAYIALLEEAEDADQRVAIVNNEGLHAIQRVRKGVYVLCRLQSWVTLDNLKALEKRWQQPHLSKKFKSDNDLSALWWQQCAIPKPQTPGERPQKCLSMLRPNHQPSQCQETGQHEEQHQEQHDEKKELTVDDVFATFITQYLHTLYLSQTPLAFFAKGPISRARAAFVSNRVEKFFLFDLVRFLRGMIQSPSSTDKKYRDKLPELLQALVDHPPGKEKKRRKRGKRQKLKPDKHAILPDEDEYLEKWWEGDINFVAEETPVQCLKRRSASLRTRETFMQLILVLEILSLEAMPEYQTEPTSKNDKDDEIDKNVKRNKSKNDNLTVTLELLADKLCIWNSLDTSDTAKPDTPKDKNPDQLRDFCIEVIIPFYLSRIPSHAKNLNKKFGGPSSSSTKPKPTVATGKPPLSLRHPTSDTKVTPSLRQSTSDSQLLSHQIKSQPSESPSLSSIPPFRRDSQTPSAPPSRRPTGIQQLRKREVDFTALAAANEAKQKRKAEIDEKLRDAISTLKRPNRVAANKDIADVAEQRRLMANARARADLQRRSKAAGDKDKDKDKDKVHVAATPAHSRNTHDVIAATPNRIPAPNFAASSHHQSQPVMPSSGPTRIPSSGLRPSTIKLSSTSITQQSRSGYEMVEEDTTVPATGRRQRTVRYQMTPTKPVLRRSMSPLQEDEEDRDDEREDEEAEDQDEAGLLPVFQTPSKPSCNVDFTKIPSTSTLGTAIVGKPLDWTRRGKEKAVKPRSFHDDVGVVAATPVKSKSLPVAGDVSVRDESATGAAIETEKEVEGKSLYDVLGWNNGDDEDFF